MLNENLYCSKCGKHYIYCKQCGEEIHFCSEEYFLLNNSHSCRQKKYYNLDFFAPKYKYCTECGTEFPSPYYCEKCGEKIYPEHHCYDGKPILSLNFYNKSGHNCKKW